MALRLLVSTLIRQSAVQQQLVPAVCNAMSTQLLSSTPRLLASANLKQFSTSIVLNDLKQTLKEELKHEKENYEKPDIISKGPPAPFTLSQTPGDTAVNLKRTYNDEDISVDASVNLQVGCPCNTDGGDALRILGGLPTGKRQLLPLNGLLV